MMSFPLLPEQGNVVLKSPGVWVADSPFPVYRDPQKALPGLRRDGFVAGIIKIYKATQGVGSAGNIVVQMRDDEGASRELERQVAQATALPCPDQCTKQVERFSVQGIPGAQGIDLRSTFTRPLSEDGITFKATNDITIVFAKGAFVYQLFAGGPGIEARRDDLIKAAQRQYERVPES